MAHPSPGGQVPDEETGGEQGEGGEEQTAREEQPGGERAQQGEQWRGQIASSLADGVERLEETGVITGYRAIVDAGAVGRGLEVLIDVEVSANDRTSLPCVLRIDSHLTRKTIKAGP
ncbi:hypothetical protein ACVB8X_05945 [Streptomyces sp. NRAIS4]